MGAKRKDDDGNKRGDLADVGAVVLVFVDAGSWWLINLSNDAVSDVTAYVCEGIIAWEPESFTAQQLAPFEQLRCPPPRLRRRRP